MCWKLNKWKYVCLLWTLISIKQNKEQVRISGKRYDPHSVETEIFTQFTALDEPFIQSTPEIK